MDDFEVIVKKFERLVYSVCFRMMYSNEQDAMDMTQETFLKFYTTLTKNNVQWENDNALAGWLCKVATNRCVDELRKRRAVVVSIDEMTEAKGDGILDDTANKNDNQIYSPEQSVISMETLEYLQKGIDTLTEEQKAAIMLRDVRGYSYEEVAEMTNSSIGTVKSRIFRGREQLKKFLREYTEL